VYWFLFTMGAPDRDSDRSTLEPDNVESRTKTGIAKGLIENVLVVFARDQAAFAMPCRLSLSLSSFHRPTER
jgi:hypothetical protein